MCSQLLPTCVLPFPASCLTLQQQCPPVLCVGAFCKCCLIVCQEAACIPLCNQGNCHFNAFFVLLTSCGGGLESELQEVSAAGSHQLQSLSSFGFTQPLAPRKRRGPLYARSSSVIGAGAKEVPTSQMRAYSDTSESKGLQQQSQWQTLGNGIFGDRVTSSPPNRNGFSSNGLQSSMFSGTQGQDGDANGQQLQSQAFANGLPANGSLFAHSGT